jgi:hypothetical protein
MVISFAFFFTLTGAKFCCFRRAFTASAVSASMMPLRTSPVRALASHANSGMRVVYRVRSQPVKRLSRFYVNAYMAPLVRRPPQLSCDRGWE